MKVKLRIDSQVSEDSVSIEARLMTESIQELVHFAQHLGKQDKIHVKKKDEIYLLDAKEIHRIYTENRQVRVRTAKMAIELNKLFISCCRSCRTISCRFLNRRLLILVISAI